MQINGYDIQAEISRSSYATLYLANYQEGKKQAAVKLFDSRFVSTDHKMGLERELTAINSLRRREIGRILDFGEYKGQFFMAMPWMARGSLAALLAQGRLEAGLIVDIATRIGAALAAVHRIGAVHADLKPENILFDEQGQACLFDFGIMHLIKCADGATINPIFCGPAYLSPELARGYGLVDQRSDQYALGAILYEMCTGSTPYKGSSPAMMAAQRLIAPIPDLTAAGFKPQIDGVIKKAMAKDPDDRYSNVKEMIRALKQTRIRSRI